MSNELWFSLLANLICCILYIALSAMEYITHRRRENYLYSWLEKMIDRNCKLEIEIHELKQKHLRIVK